MIIYFIYRLLETSNCNRYQRTYVRCVSRNKKNRSFIIKVRNFFVSIVIVYLTVINRHADGYLRTTITNIEPYAVKSGQYIQKQWTLLLKYIEGPIYDKCYEIAEQVS